MNLKKILIPVVILFVGALATRALINSRPEVETREVEPLAPLVRVIEVERQDLTFDVIAQGTVLPRTETTLIAQVAGVVVRTASSFETGGFFSRGDTLVELDPRDYEVAVRRANAQVAQARLQVVQQEAEAEVAIEEWQQLGEGEPNALVTREPQVAQARAALEAAEAELEKAKLDLERTRIRAPFAGRIRSKRVDLGQFLAPGTPLATIHATDYAEIRLPVPDDELAYLDLPFAYRDAAAGAAGPEVTLSASFGRETHRWPGRIVRTEGELDSRTRMLNLVARVEDPYVAPKGRKRDTASADAPDRPPLAVGLFVEAEIAGRTSPDVAILPRSALRPAGDGFQVMLVDEDNRLRFRDVEVVRLEGERAIIGDGLNIGEAVCVSVLDVATDGMKVRVAAEDRS